MTLYQMITAISNFRQKAEKLYCKTIKNVDDDDFSLIQTSAEQMDDAVLSIHLRNYEMTEYDITELFQSMVELLEIIYSHHDSQPGNHEAVCEANIEYNLLLHEIQQTWKVLLLNVYHQTSKVHENNNNNTNNSVILLHSILEVIASTKDSKLLNTYFHYLNEYCCIFHSHESHEIDSHDEGMHQRALNNKPETQLEINDKIIKLIEKMLKTNVSTTIVATLHFLSEWLEQIRSLSLNDGKESVGKNNPTLHEIIKVNATKSIENVVKVCVSFLPSIPKSEVISLCEIIFECYDYVHPLSLHNKMNVSRNEDTNHYNKDSNKISPTNTNNVDESQQKDDGYFLLNAIRLRTKLFWNDFTLDNIDDIILISTFSQMICSHLKKSSSLALSYFSFLQSNLHINHDDKAISYTSNHNSIESHCKKSNDSTSVEWTWLDSLVILFLYNEYHQPTTTSSLNKSLSETIDAEKVIVTLLCQKSFPFDCFHEMIRMAHFQRENIDRMRSTSIFQHYMKNPPLLDLTQFMSNLFSLGTFFLTCPLQLTCASCRLSETQIFIGDNIHSFLCSLYPLLSQPSKRKLLADCMKISSPSYMTSVAKRIPDSSGKCRYDKLNSVRKKRSRQQHDSTMNEHSFDTYCSLPNIIQHHLCQSVCCDNISFSYVHLYDTANLSLRIFASIISSGPITPDDILEMDHYYETIYERLKSFVSTYFFFDKNMVDDISLEELSMTIYRIAELYSSILISLTNFRSKSTKNESRCLRLMTMLQQFFFCSSIEKSSDFVSRNIAVGFIFAKLLIRCSNLSSSETHNILQWSNRWLQMSEGGFNPLTGYYGLVFLNSLCQNESITFGSDDKTENGKHLYCVKEIFNQLKIILSKTCLIKEESNLSNQHGNSSLFYKKIPKYLFEKEHAESLISGKRIVFCISSFFVEQNPTVSSQYDCASLISWMRFSYTLFDTYLRFGRNVSEKWSSDKWLVAIFELPSMNFFLNQWDDNLSMMFSSEGLLNNTVEIEETNHLIENLSSFLFAIGLLGAIFTNACDHYSTNSSRDRLHSITKPFAKIHFHLSKAYHLRRATFGTLHHLSRNGIITTKQVRIVTKEITNFFTSCFPVNYLWQSVVALTQDTSMKEKFYVLETNDDNASECNVSWYNNNISVVMDILSCMTDHLLLSNELDDMIEYGNRQRLLGDTLPLLSTFISNTISYVSHQKIRTSQNKSKDPEGLRLVNIILHRLVPVIRFIRHMYANTENSDSNGNPSLLETAAECIHSLLLIEISSYSTSNSACKIVDILDFMYKHIDSSLVVKVDWNHIVSAIQSCDDTDLFFTSNLDILPYSSSHVFQRFYQQMNSLNTIPHHIISSIRRCILNTSLIHTEGFEVCYYLLGLWGIYDGHGCALVKKMKTLVSTLNSSIPLILSKTRAFNEPHPNMPVMNEEKHFLMFEILLYLSIASFCISAPTIKSKTDDFNTNVTSPYQDFHDFASIFASLIKLYSLHIQVFPVKLFSIVANTCCLVLEACEYQANICIQWRNSQICLTSPETNNKRKRQSDWSSTSHLRILLNMIEYCVHVIHSFCEEATSQKSTFSKEDRRLLSTLTCSCNKTKVKIHSLVSLYHVSPSSLELLSHQSTSVVQIKRPYRSNQEIKTPVMVVKSKTKGVLTSKISHKSKGEDNYDESRAKLKRNGSEASENSEDDESSDGAFGVTGDWA